MLLIFCFVVVSGTFRTDEEGESITDCTPCTPGYYCPGYAETEPTMCGKGNYSEDGWAACEPCLEGR